MALSSILRVFKSFPNPLRGSTPGTISELPPSYSPKYPYNNVNYTSSGHLIEMDDTPGAERVQITHRTGSHIEMRPDGAVKYKSMKNRQDITIGDQDVIIQGDFNITIDGGTKILVRNGALEIQADYGAAVNVKGELKLSADNIRMQAKKKISLVAPFVDIGGGNGIPPYMALPYGVVPIFGVPVPVMTGLSVPKAPSMPIPSAGANPAAGVASLVGSVTAVVGQLNTIASFAKNIAKSKALFAAMKDPFGDPLVPEVDQPEELPLSNPRLYSGVNIDSIRLRDRQLDSPDDIDDSEIYTAHINVMEDLKDLTASDKDLPGQKLLSDETLPRPEPIPATAFLLKAGTVSCTIGDETVTGTGTKFTEELTIGQTLKIKDQSVVISSIQDDTTLLLSEPWGYPSISNTNAYVYILRPFVEFFDKYKYALTQPLGTSHLTLSNMMRNYIPPTIEKDVSGVTVPSAPSSPTTTVGGGAVDVEVRVPYDETKQQQETI